MASDERDRPRWLEAVPVALALLVGLSTLGGGFVFDDHYAIRQNPVVAGQLGVGAAWTHDFWGAPLHQGARSYRPLVVSLWRGLMALGGAPWCFRLVSALAHAGCTELFRRWCVRLFEPRARTFTLAWVAAALFAVHPVHAEALGANVAHADLLGTLAGLVAALLGVRSWGRAVATATALAISGLCKETFVVFAAVVALEGWIERGRTDGGQRGVGWRLLPSAMVTAGLVALHLSIDRSDALDPFNNLGVAAEGLGSRLAWGLCMVGRGAAMTVVPVGASPVHDYASVTLSWADLGPWAGLGGAVLAFGLGLGLWAVAKRQARRAELVGLCLWLMPLVLASNLLFDTLTGLAERLLYLPTLGVVLWGVGLADRLVGRIAAPSSSRLRIGVTRLEGAVLGALLVGSLVAGWPARRAWRSSAALWHRAVQVTPASMRAHANLGATLLNEGAVEAGVVHIAVSRHIAESYPHPVSPSRWDRLMRLPVERAVVEAPGELAGAGQACAFASRVLAVLAQTRPDVASGLAPVWGRRWCEPSSLRPGDG